MIEGCTLCGGVHPLSQCPRQKPASQKTAGFLSEEINMLREVFSEFNEETGKTARVYYDTNAHRYTVPSRRDQFEWPYFDKSDLDDAIEVAKKWADEPTDKNGPANGRLTGFGGV